MKNNYYDIINKQRAYQVNFIKEYSEIGDSNYFGGKHCGSDAEREGSMIIAGELEKIGVDDVEVVPVTTDRFMFRDATLKLDNDDPDTRIIKPYGVTSNGTDSEGISAEIVICEKQSLRNADSKDISGKIVLYQMGSAFESDDIMSDSLCVLEAQKKGAVAVVMNTSEDILYEDTITTFPMNVLADIPVLTISAKDAKYIRTCLDADVQAKFSLHADMSYEIDGGETYEVIGRIKGSKINESIMYTAHIDHYFRSIQDNMSAVSTLLGIAKSFVDNGFTPNRDILFVFNGSHETGNINSSNPDFRGPYSVMKYLEERGENIVANINFEYTAMHQKKLRSFTTYEAGDTYQDFVKTMPKEVAGFDLISDEHMLDNYSILTWCDALISIINGVPVYMNDAIGEQLVGEPTPYDGRDHSNHDDMEIFDEETLSGNTFWYGSLGVYLDSLPLIQNDFRKRAEYMLLDQAQKKLIENAGVDIDNYNGELEAFIIEADSLLRLIKDTNLGLVKNADSSNEIDWSVVNKINNEQRDALKQFADFTDWITPESLGMLTIVHTVYINNLEKLEVLKQNLIDKSSIPDILNIVRDIDLGAVSVDYGVEYSKLLRELSFSDRATWGSGRTCEPLIFEEFVRVIEEGIKQNSENNEGGSLSRQVNDTLLKLTEKMISEQSNRLRESIKIEEENIRKLKNKIIKIRENLDELNVGKASSDYTFPQECEIFNWIKGFTKWPHRKTGTKEGRESAEYVKNVFNDVGLKDVEIEQVDSIAMRMKNYELYVDGEQIEAFYANATNRGRLTGTFEIGTNNEEYEIVYLNKGTEEDFEQLDVKDKIVICDITFHDLHPIKMLEWSDNAMVIGDKKKIQKPLKKYDIFNPKDWPYNYYRAMDKGAKGFVGILHNFMDANYYHEDYSEIVENPNSKYMSLPAMWVSKTDGQKIIKKIKNNKSTRCLMKMKTTYELTKANNVVGKLEGISDDIILIHSHHDAVCEGAVQDASGMSVVFSIAKYFSQFKKNELPYTLMFAATDSHYEDYEGHVGLLDKRKEKRENLLIDIVVEHVAKEMDLDENMEMTVNNEPETRILYVSNNDGLVEKVKTIFEKYNLDKTVLFPVETFVGEDDVYEFKTNDVCSDGSVSWAEGIPVVSLLAAPMYLYHNTDTLDKVYTNDLRPIGQAFAEIIQYIMKGFKRRTK